ncbi:zinc ribbon domain-containing protein [Streptomyces violascens]|uniref:zinc ribbon domain-containing protein n=1 Tax=Streptomyces violascens TaxID=67381 RepID=UPI00364F621C
MQGAVVCGICGDRMTVRYHERKHGLEPEYLCERRRIEYGDPICQRIPGAGIDAAVGQLLVDKLTPLAIEAALAVADELAARADEADRLRKAGVERARYQADLARRRYLAVDPDNRLVAQTLESDWNTALRELNDATEAYEKAKAIDSASLDGTHRARIIALASNFPALWNNPDTPMRERKRLARLLVTDVTLVRGEEQITAHVRLNGGQSHTLTLPVPLASWQIRKTPPDVIRMVDELLNEYTDGRVAAILTDRGYISGRGQSLQPRIIRSIREAYGLRSHPQRLADLGMMSLNEMSRRMNVCTKTIEQWRDEGRLTGRVANDKGEYFYFPPGPDFTRPRIGRRPKAETLTASAGRGAV